MYLPGVHGLRAHLVHGRKRLRNRSRRREQLLPVQRVDDEERQLVVAGRDCPLVSRRMRTRLAPSCAVRARPRAVFTSTRVVPFAMISPNQLILPPPPAMPHSPHTAATGSGSVTAASGAAASVK